MRYPKFLAVCAVFVVIFFVLVVFVNKSHYTFADFIKSKRTEGRVDLNGVNSKTCGDLHCSIFRETSDYCKDISQVSSYIVKAIVPSNIGIKISLVNSNKSSVENEKYGKTLSQLTVVMTAQTNRRFHVKIVDVDEKRWQIPKWVVPVPDESIELPLSVHYYIKHSSVGEPFNFAIIRKLDGDVIFDTCKAQELYFADQFLSIGTKLPTKYNVYGLGEHVVPSLRLPPRTYTLWNYDAQTPKYHNLYGSHPFYLEHRANAKSHGVFLKNSNGMDVILDKDSLTYNVLGGVFDFYFFLGPQPESVIQQYQEVIGRPKMPTYWGLGFHQCRYGYKNVQELQQVVKRFREESIPLDTMWTDIDYMNKYRDFTLSPVNFPESKMKEFVKDLHQNEQYYVVIIDPGIKVEQGYEPYDTGLKMDIFIKTYNGKIYNGKVWPGVTAFPDFFNPHINQYWEDEMSKFRQLLPIDGIWLDMNEIASFHDGEISDDKHLSTLNDPPYAIDNQGSKKPLMKKTVSPDAVHYGGLKEYDVHNLYGHTETMATSKALQNITKKRSFVIGRSTFSGTGSYGGHWTGDNHATWQDLGQSVIDVLNFQLYSIPFVGADICGFGGDTTEELCARWMALGAFYPFSRSHSQRRSKPQEPYLWKSVADVSRKVLSIRYSLLPYYYTLFYKACSPADTSLPTATVLRPLFFEFPNDPQTFSIHNQFMIGDTLLVTPVLAKGVKEVNGYFPNAWWYDYHSLKKVTEGQTTLKLPAPLDNIQIHIRGGSIVPTQLPSLTTAATRRNQLLLLVALDRKGSAHGELYWDDGVSIKSDHFVLVHFDVHEATLTSNVYGPQYNDELPVIGNVKVLGVKEETLKVTVNGVSHSGFSYDGSNGVLKIDGLNLLMRSNFAVSWIS